MYTPSQIFAKSAFASIINIYIRDGKSFFKIQVKFFL